MAVMPVGGALLKSHKSMGPVGIVFPVRQGGSGLPEATVHGPGKEVKGCAIQS